MYIRPIKIINLFLFLFIVSFGLKEMAMANSNLFKGEVMNLNEIFYINLKVKDKFAKQSKKVKIENKKEIEIIVYSISHYKEKRLLDLICMYQLEIYGTGGQIIRTYEVGEFRNNKNILLIRDKERNEDYIIDGEGAAKIYEYLGQLK